MSLSAAGCGQVESGVCAGEQVDNVACTVDICDGEAKAWAHIPNDDLCEVGQRCDATAGCVAAGALTGHATLFGHDDHSGITVSIDGVEGATATTDAMGNWAFGGLPTGTFTVTYTKADFITQSEPGVSVLPAAASSPPDVELRHGADFENGQWIDFYNMGDYYNGTFYSPDKKHLVVRYNRYYDGTDYYAYNLSAMSKKGQPMFHDTNLYGPGHQIWVSNTHMLWNINSQVIWSRPLDGGPSVILASVPPNESITVATTPAGEYAVLQRTRNTGVFTETTLYSVKVDGSAPMGTPSWTQPDAQHQFAWVVNNETTALFGVNNSTASPPSDGQASTPLHRIDLATGAMTNVNAGFATNSSGAFSVSPDGKNVYGYLLQTNWYRSFLIPISGTNAPTLAPTYGAPTGTQYSDYPGNGHQWFTDSSGVILASSSYPLSAGGTAEGGLKVWHLNQPQSTLLVANAAYYAGQGGYNGWNVHHKVVTYRDTGSATSPFKAVSAHSTSPVIYNLDTSGFYLNDFQSYDAADGMSSYLVWTQSINAGNSTRAKVFSANISVPLLAAPGVVQLGGTLATSCAYEGVLSKKAYWQLCQDTGVLSGFAASTATAGTQTQGVRGGLIAMPDADRVAFRKYDGKVYSSPNMGAMTELKLVSTTWDGSQPLRAAGNWIIFNDANGGYLRASNADGSGIDEPLSKCEIPSVPYSNNPPQAYADPDKTHIVMPFMKCGVQSYGEIQLPVANLP